LMLTWNLNFAKIKRCLPAIGSPLKVDTQFFYLFSFLQKLNGEVNMSMIAVDFVLHFSLRHSVEERFFI
jgi:hypothetical protein